MDIADKARKLERKLARSVDAAIGELVGRDEPAPLEMVHEVLDRAEHEVQDAGRGRRVFPYNRIRIYVFADPDQSGRRAKFDAVAAGPPSLSERLLDRLRSAGCGDTRVSVEVVHTSERGLDWPDPRFHVTFDRAAEPPQEPAPEPVPSAPADVRRLKLTVVKGAAEQRAYAFSGGRIDIGRRAEVVDQKQRLIRTNQIAFLDEDVEENRTVSRRHAHIEYVAAEGCYRIFDDRSAQGTDLLRGGRTVKVPAGQRGARLAAGDEIALGQARLKVEIK